jgi:hypothetical protein
MLARGVKLKDVLVIEGVRYVRQLERKPYNLAEASLAYGEALRVAQENRERRASMCKQQRTLAVA